MTIAHTNHPHIGSRQGALAKAGLRIAAVCALLLATLLVTAEASAAKPLTWAQIEAVVKMRLAGHPGYRQGDLISRVEIEPIFNELLELGFQSAENEELYDSFLREKDPLVRLFATDAGKAFMRQVAAIPHVYDRLERLSWSQTGRAILDDLIARPNGPQLFQAMLTPGGAKATEQTLAADPRGKNFLKPTGHIHTEAELLARMRTAYEQQTRSKPAARK